MGRVAFLWLTCFGVLEFIRGLDSTATIPACEDKGPNDVYIDLSYMGLSKIRKSFVSGTSVTCINLEGNDVSIDPGAFDDVPELKYLNLGGNRIQLDNFVTFAVFSKLETLILDRIMFTEEFIFHQKGALVLPQLRTLAIRHSSISSYGWPPRGEGALFWLHKFDAPKLTHIHLIGSSLEMVNLPEAITKSLTHLYLDDNNVHRLTGRNMQNLRYLSMENNLIVSLCSVYCNENSVSPRDWHELEYLSLARNEIVSVASDAFENSSNLRSLNLTNNKIDHFDRHTFDNMTNLKNLTLNYNQLTTVPDVSPLKKLEILSLDHNSIMFIDETSFCNLSQLTVIQLKGNRLVTVSAGAFENLPALVELDLSLNKIVSLPANWISKLVILKTLNLYGNLFTDLESMSVRKIESLEYLNIGGNPLKSITAGLLFNFPPDTEIDVSRTDENYGRQCCSYC